MSKPKPPESPLFSRGKIVLDWKQYFLSFCQVHGEPVLFKGKLLFKDGWTYSSTSYEGPEYPPPIDNSELDALILAYWKLRQTILTAQVFKLQHGRKQLQDLIASRSLPLQHIAIVEDGDSIKRKVPKMLDPTIFDMKIEWIQESLVECDTRLKEIEDFHKLKEVR